MRKYRNNAGSQVRVLYGTELIEGLRNFEETAGLAVPLQDVNHELDKAHEDRLAKAKERGPLRARLRAAEYQVDRLIREIARAAELADGGRRGPTHAAVFPEGLSPVVAARGSRQIKPTESFLLRLEARGTGSKDCAPNTNLACARPSTD